MFDEILALTQQAVVVRDVIGFGRAFFIYKNPLICKGSFHGEFGNKSRTVVILLTPLVPPTHPGLGLKKTGRAFFWWPILVFHFFISQMQVSEILATVSHFLPIVNQAKKTLPLS